MRQIEHISPSSMGNFYANPIEYYISYLADNRPDRLPQTKHMAVGSAFDAFAKSYLHEKLFGKGNDPRFELISIFEAQVESHNRDAAFDIGKKCFERYLLSGALGDLMIELNAAIGKPRFEIEIKGTIEGRRDGTSRVLGGVVFLGKPDVFFINKKACQVQLDWKVNGYYAIRNPPSPMPGYVRLRELNGVGKYVNKGSHKQAQVMNIGGVMTNVATTLEDENADWARQLSIYAWLCGIEVGGKYIAAIDQLVGPDIRIAEHRLQVTEKFQWEVWEKAAHMWDVVHSDYIFRDLTLERSQELCAQLDKRADALKGDGSEADQWFNKMSRT